VGKQKRRPGKPKGKRASEKGQEKGSLRERLFKALAHPLRYQILTLLNDREWSPNELSDELPEGLSQVSYHVKVLSGFKLIEMTKTRPARGAVEHFYKAIERPIVDMDMAQAMPKSGRHIVIGGILGEINEDVKRVNEGRCVRLPSRLPLRPISNASHRPDLQARS